MEEMSVLHEDLFYLRGMKQESEDSM